MHQDLKRRGSTMDSDDKLNRRDFMATTALVAGVAALPRVAQAAEKPPPGFDQQTPLLDNWNKSLADIVDVDVNLKKDAPELGEEAVKERHRIYCYLLMKLISRFWNGNKRGPTGIYPYRTLQTELAQPSNRPQRYKGDIAVNPGPDRVNWDRYLGHNIACIAVDGKGDIIDFDFNHNDFFRSSAEHAESRMVRRLFSLADIFDGWKTGAIKGKPPAASLTDVTLYTSLESCAQCSGVMSLAGVKQIIYLQNDFTAYKIGNIMYNLANRRKAEDARGAPLLDWQGKAIASLPSAPIPIAAKEINLDEFDLLNQRNLEFIEKIERGHKAFQSDPKKVDGAFFVPEQGPPDFDPSITSFLCTDDAYNIFKAGGDKLDSLRPSFDDWRFPARPDKDEILTNGQCLDQAKKFYDYADVEGFRGSPHKL
jgi:tRNA(Arg) A34 adenosine deaminase TadA